MLPLGFLQLFLVTTTRQRKQAPTLFDEGGNKINISRYLPVNRYKTAVNTLQDDIFSTDEFDRGDSNLSRFEIESEWQDPVACPPYKMSFRKHRKRHPVIEKFLEKRIQNNLERLRIPTIFGHKYFRLEIYYQKINRLIEPDPYPRANKDVRSDTLRGSNYFTLRDIIEVFIQDRLERRIASTQSS